MKYPFEGKVIEADPFQGRRFSLIVEGIEQPILLWPMSTFRESFANYLGQNVIIEGYQDPRGFENFGWHDAIEVRTMKEAA